MTDYSDLVKRLRGNPVRWSDSKEVADAIEAQAKQIEELQQLVARIVELNDIDSDVADYIRWEILVADARKASEAADWKASRRALGEKDNVARIAELEAALKPFADAGHHDEVTHGNLIAARKVLGEIE